MSKIIRRVLAILPAILLQALLRIFARCVKVIQDLPASAKFFGKKSNLFS